MTIDYSPLPDVPFIGARAVPLLMVTGAQGGIGSAVQHLALARGWRVVALSRRAAAAPAEAADGQWLAVQADCSSAVGAEAGLVAAQKHFGQWPTHLCLAAGAVRLGAIERVSEAAYREVLAANLDASWYPLQAWSKLRGAEPGGAALLFSSVAAQMGTPNHAAVAAAKGAVEGLVRSLAADWAARGWRINALALGLHETPMTEAFTKGDRQRQAVTAQYPLPRLGNAAEAAAWALQLLDAEGWMTGQVLALDGGFTRIRPLVRTP
jgi:NAD(P)-dependent dehydrogenase (short-subunit alcohol dehydrogenase family)